MLRSIIISAGGALAFSLLAMLFQRARGRESDSEGNPELRYLAAPYLMAGCAVVFLVVAIFQWMDPLNHQYPGNLLMLSYMPLAIGLFVLAFSVYLFTFRAVLLRNEIRLYRWPLGLNTFELMNMQRIDSKPHKTVLHFARGRKFVVYSHLSGHAYFLQRLTANNSVK